MAGGRPQKKKLQLNNEETVNKILQEIYNENLELKSSIRKLYVKWERYVISETEVGAIGKNIYDILNLLQRHHTTKLDILKFMRDYNLDSNKITLGYDKLQVEKDNIEGKSEDASQGNEVMSAARKSELRKMVEDANKRKSL